ncbi:ABC transporter permease [Sphingobacterium paramultivorum]|uniref:ABC transporter permease n=1 Tax=Sphingobacterium paramultivorum TaxID=2886510 RepID=A0A7G5E3K7_9SPHI|nr:MULTISPECIES: FtsX-like permease family protein [Sphingobacterium]QMV68582.1 ABC transporter permease [Sphingobacterium paramultivorum]WSO17525.1 FtsX-like permease family protein [Sphingobacterium paramultivorum]
MNTIQLVWKNLSRQFGSVFLSILLTAFGISILAVLSITGETFEKQLDNNSKNIDLVVGAKGSPLQLILSSVYHIDNPTGNIPLDELEPLRQNPLVQLAVPLSLGDNFKGHRIVGTDSSFLSIYETSVAEGRIWQSNFEVVIGDQVAKKQQLKIGDQIHSSHGLSKDGHHHDEHPFTIVGILKHNNNVTDNLILTNLESVWDVHGIAHKHEHQETAVEKELRERQEDREETLKAHLHHHGEDIAENSSAPAKTNEKGRHEQEEHTDHEEGAVFVKSIGSDMVKQNGLEITAILLKYQSPAAIGILPKLIDQQTDMQAASPAMESTRLFSLLGVGIDSLSILAYVIMFIAGLSVFINLYNALKQRKYDLAIMRTLGASKGKLFAIVLLEGLTITILGGLIGLIMAHLALYYISNQTSQSADFIEAFTLHPKELIFLFVACLIGIFAALIPAIKAYRTSISGTLSNK